MKSLSTTPEPFKADWDRLLHNDDVLDSIGYWMRECVWTRDETAEGRAGISSVYKRFPWDNRPDLRRLTEFKMTHSGLFIELGSRKTMKTWKEAARYAYIGLTQEARHIMVGSTKEDRADMNLQRIVFILSTFLSLDNSGHKDRVDIHRRTADTLELTNGSTYQVLSQNVYDLTQITASAVWQDEFSKIDDSLKKGIISTGLPATQKAVGEHGDVPGAGFSVTGTCEGEERMWKMMFPDEESLVRLISPYEDIKNNEGLRCPENGLKIWSEGDVHRILFYYFADPGKVPGSDWYKKERPKWVGNEDGWNREMEIWPLGDTEYKVTPEYKDGKHRRTFDELSDMYETGVPLVIGWDIGGRYQCATVTQRNPRTTRIMTFSQYYEDNRDLESFAHRVVGMVKEDFPDAMAYHVGDPRSLSTSTGTAIGDLSDVLQRAGVYCRPSPGISVQRKIAILKKALADYVEGEPKLLIAGDRCRELIKALRGAYQYAKTGSGRIATTNDATAHSIDSFVFCLIQHEYLADEDMDDVVDLGRGIHSGSVVITGETKEVPAL